MSRTSTSFSSIDYALLGFLIPKPLHGYELFQILQDTPGLSRIWTLKQALFYAKLEKIEKAGWCYTTTEPSPTSSPPRKYLHITDRGVAAFEGWVEQPILKSRFFRQDFLTKLILVQQLQPDCVTDVLSKQITVTTKWVENLEHDIGQNESSDAVEDRLISSFRLLQGQAVLRWLHQVMQELSPKTLH